MKILIDADGCPVTKSAIEIGNEFGIKALFFAIQAINLILKA